MVTLDMTKTRQRIHKRKRRLRQLQRRRVEKMRQQQKAQIVAAHTARLAREKAVQKWLTEEQRLDHTRTNDSDSPLTSERKSRVRFADNVFVTEIPVQPQHSLPDPITSPTGVKLLRDSESPPPFQPFLSSTANNVRFQLFTTHDKDYNESDDSDFAPDSDEEIGQIFPKTMPQRRILPVLVDANPSPDPLTKQVSMHPSPSLCSPISKKKPFVKQLNLNPKDLKPNLPSFRPPKPSTDQPRSSTDPPQPSTPPMKRSKRKRKRKVSDSDDGDGLPSSTMNGNSKPKTGPPADASAKDAASLQGSVSPKARAKKKRKLDNGHQNSPESKSNCVANPSEGKGSKDMNGNCCPAPTLKKQSSNDIAKEKEENGSENGAVVAGSSDESDIESLFSELFRQKAAKMKAESRKSKAESKKEANKPKFAKKNKTVNQCKKGTTRYTGEGLRIMSYDDIRAEQPPGLNGDCPFDCSCCL